MNGFKSMKTTAIEDIPRHEEAHHDGEPNEGQSPLLRSAPPAKPLMELRLLRIQIRYHPQYLPSSTLQTMNKRRFCETCPLQNPILWWQRVIAFGRSIDVRSPRLGCRITTWNRFKHRYDQKQVFFTDLIRLNNIAELSLILLWSLPPETCPFGIRSGQLHIGRRVQHHGSQKKV